MFVDRSIRVDRRDANAALGVDPEEIDANNFAAALLMPQEMILAAVAQISLGQGAAGSIEMIRRLASRFDVSTQAMEYRLAQPWPRRSPTIAATPRGSSIGNKLITWIHEEYSQSAAV